MNRHLYHSVSDVDQNKLQDSASLAWPLEIRWEAGPRELALRAFCQGFSELLLSENMKSHKAQSVSSVAEWVVCSAFSQKTGECLLLGYV